MHDSFAFVSKLPAPIPVFDIGGGGADALAASAPERLALILASAETRYGRIPLRLGDALSRQWLMRANNPYLPEIDTVAARLGRAGAHLLNLSYEWTCTSGVAPDPSGAGNRMLRTLDWPLDGLGRALVVARQSGAAGDYLNVTWPGFAGIATAMAPGRFAAALNQAPMPRYTPSCWLDWAVTRIRLAARGQLPPAHLLRRVFDTCRTYAEARAQLVETPMCLPAIFVLSGAEPDQGCVIERTETGASVRESPACSANHWQGFHRPGRARGADSVKRARTLAEIHRRAPDGFAWLTAPILNRTTRAAVVANARRGTLWVQGFEADGPATAPLTLP
ncbi:MAG: hypothetical protein FJ311_00840 [Rhodospirillales bacterium]|nr:hypothetical protein [Rhodospirillales bacterium]